jgi:hypothetical protein
MKYNHMSPQYQYLIDKIEEQEKRIAFLCDELKACDITTDWLRSVIKERNQEMHYFNTLPWYKKIFFMFKV